MLRRGGILVVATALAAACAGTAHASLYTNTAPITVPGCAENDCSVAGPGDPYPSTIDVAGLPAQLAGVRVTLRGIQHVSPDDIDALLVAPGGQKEILMSDACAGSPLTGQTLMFEATGPALPATGPCAPAVYAASNYPPAETFAPPAPGPPYGSSLAELAGAPSNGAWRLFLSDDGSGTGVGTITGGWRLELLPQASCAGRPAAAYENVGSAGNDVITGTPGPDVIFGLGGDDLISGLGGKDVICGGEGNDTLLGGPGKDLLRGEAGNDKLKGQGGRDKLKGGAGGDLCKGGAKPDIAKACEKRKSI